MARSTGTTPGGQGRFDGYDVLGQVSTWDQVTAGVVLRRLGPPEPMRFFTPGEEAVAGALFDHLLGQWDEPKVPVLAMVDQRLTENRTDGWHQSDLPPDQSAWRLTLSLLDSDAAERHGCGFAAQSRDRQAAVIRSVQDRARDAEGSWHGLPAKHVWSLWTRYACTAFYAHPWAWNEIGFGGPAYPRGYKNVGLDKREPWERPERSPHDPIPGIRAAQSRPGGAR
jgi:gluconate 2-dehydrogenase subunit 3-like protein